MSQLPPGRDVGDLRLYKPPGIGERCSMLSKERAHGICAQVFEQSPTEDVEVLLFSTRGNSLRIAECGPSEQNALEEISLQIRVVREGRQGRARAASVDPASTGEALDTALKAAVLSPPLELPPLASKSGGGDGGQEEESVTALAEHPPAEKIAQVREYLEAARSEGLAVTGFYDTEGASVTYATGRGCFRHAFVGKARFSSTVIAEPGGAGVAGAVRQGEPLPDDEVAEVGRRAMKKALDSRDPRELEPGEYVVLLEPKAAGDLVMFLAMAGFGARGFLDGRSFLSGRIGTQVLSEKLTFLDDAGDPRFRGLRFDCEGQDRKRVVLVEKGIAKGPVWDRPTAEEGGTSTTGHAGPQPSVSGPNVSNLILRAEGEATKDLMEGVERGLLVTQFHYTNLIDPLPVTVTGMTRNGTFLIENGRITGPVRNLRFTQSLVETFSRVRAVGDDGRLVEPFFGGSVVTPSLLCEGFRFTSSTEF